ncbi:MAG: YraN family protein [Myxococcota bacterium]
MSGSPSSDERRQARLSGYEAEAYVADLLQQVGWSVLDRNWTSKVGELDAVVLRDGKLRFVEVRARQDAMVPTVDTIDFHKQRKLRRVAKAWMLASDVAFDEVAFLVALVDLSTEPWSVEWIDDAFDGG